MLLQGTKFKGPKRHHSYVGVDGWVYRIDNVTKKVIRLNERVAYGESLSKPLFLGINHVKRMVPSKHRNTAEAKLVGDYKNEAWRQLANHRAGVRREDKVSNVQRSPKRHEKTKKG